MIPPLLYILYAKFKKISIFLRFFLKLYWYFVFYYYWRCFLWQSFFKILKKLINFRYFFHFDNTISTYYIFTNLSSFLFFKWDIYIKIHLSSSTSFINAVFMLFLFPPYTSSNKLSPIVITLSGLKFIFSHALSKFFFNGLWANPM